MNFSNLVERMVPLVAELFATLKANDPLRMDFADIAHKTLLDIVEVLNEEGLSNEVIAESLGMTISGFYKKIKELRSTYSTPSGGRRAAPSLMERVYKHVHDNGSPTRPVSYNDLTDHFHLVPADRLNAVLRFLVRYSLLSVAGHGIYRQYRIVPRSEQAPAGYQDVVLMLYRDGPMSTEQLEQRLQLSDQELERHISRLRDNGRLEETTGDDSTPRYRATAYHIPVGTPEGFEAALWDHFSTMVRAMCKKVRLAKYGAAAADVVGGATASFEVPVDSPEYAEISGFLKDSRERLQAWFERVQPYIDDRDPGREYARVSVYVGQMVEADDPGND